MLSFTSFQLSHLFQERPDDTFLIHLIPNRKERFHERSYRWDEAALFGLCKDAEDTHNFESLVNDDLASALLINEQLRLRLVGEDNSFPLAGVQDPRQLGYRFATCFL